MSRSIRCRTGALLALLFAYTLGIAQEITGAITGIIRDNSGAVLPEAVLTATNLGTALEVRVTTDETGAYTFALLRPGRYRLTVEKAGFQRMIRENVVVNTAERLRLDMGLEVGQVTESYRVGAVSVTAKRAGDAGSRGGRAHDYVNPSGHA
jgi:hypothetical protein